MKQSVRTRSLAAIHGSLRPVERDLAEETAVALVYDGSTQAVMMATAADLEDFALGFSLTERIVATPAEIETLDVVPQGEGVEVRIWLADASGAALKARRRQMAGPVGCGLCGIDSLAEALRPVPEVGGGVTLAPDDVGAAMAALGGAQPLHDRVHAVHAAGFWRPGEGLVAAREDVGRHNALDKLVGALARGGIDAGGGAVVLTSRVSVDLVQKAAIAGAGLLIAVSAPTAHAVRLADAAGITLVALTRGETFEIYTHPARITGAPQSHVA